PNRRALSRDGRLPDAVPRPDAALDRPHRRPSPGPVGARPDGGGAMIDVAPFAANWQVALPGLLVTATALLVMAVDAVLRTPDRDGLAVIGVLGVVAAAGAAAWLWLAGGDVGGFQDTLRADRYALFFAILLCAGTLLTLVMSVDFLREQPL